MRWQEEADAKEKERFLRGSTRCSAEEKEKKRERSNARSHPLGTLAHVAAASEHVGHSLSEEPSHVASAP
eukprot:3295846-Rhodomonas_salina.1